MVSFLTIEVGEYSIMRVLSDLLVKDFNVGVASAISSYARCRLWSLINDIESRGKSVYVRYGQYHHEYKNK